MKKYDYVILGAGLGGLSAASSKQFIPFLWDYVPQLKVDLYHCLVLLLDK